MNSAEFWNSIATEYASGRTKSREFILDPALFSVIGDVKGKKVLDIGAGAGGVAIPLAQNGAVCIAVDISEKMIEIAQKEATRLGVSITFKVMDIKQLSEIKDRFDLAIITLLLPHIPNIKDINRTLKNVHMLLASNGRLVIGEPHPSFDYYMRNNIKSGDFNYAKSGFPYEFSMDINEKNISGQAYHWTLEDYFSAIANSGFVIKKILEPKPNPKSKVVDPEWFEERSKYPPYIIFDCVRK